MSDVSSSLAGELERAAAFRSLLRRFLARTDEVASGAGLTPQRYDLLLMVKTGTDGTSTVTEVSRRLALQQSAVTELVKRTEGAGLIERATSPSDGRLSVLSLTAEGERRLMAAFVKLHEERRTLARAMRAVGTSFRRSVGEDAEARAADGV